MNYIRLISYFIITALSAFASALPAKAVDSGTMQPTGLPESADKYLTPDTAAFYELSQTGKIELKETATEKTEINKGAEDDIISEEIIREEVEPKDTVPLSKPDHGELYSLLQLRHRVVAPVRPFPEDSLRLAHKSFWRASAEVLGINVAVWGFDRLMRKDSAYISWGSIWNNIKTGFRWDNDNLTTNTFLHPYHGSLYFNSARSNGFNFWQSECFAIFGSLMWEMCMETNAASTNDFIATPIGGAAVGEVLYRTSDIVLDDRTTGWTRFGRELAAFVISPMRGFTRLITGRAWEHRATTGRRFGTPPVSVSFSLGMRMLTFHDEEMINRLGGLARIDIEYGDRFIHKSMVPYEYFTFLMELNMMKTQPIINRIEIRGRLMSKELVDHKRHHLFIGMYQHFDYFDSDTITDKTNPSLSRPCVVPYKLGTPASIGCGLMYRYAKLPQWTINAYLHTNAVILSGVLSDFYRVRNRNYNWSSGYSIKAGFIWSTRSKKFSANVSTQVYRLFTWGGYDPATDWSLYPGGEGLNIQGDRSKATFSHLEARLNYRIWRNLFFTTSVDWYHRHTYYNNWQEYNSVNGNTPAHRMTGPVIGSNQVAFNMMLTYEL